MILSSVLAILPWDGDLSESLEHWRITQDWLKGEPNGFHRLTAARDIVWQFFSGHNKGHWKKNLIPNLVAVLLFIFLLVAMTWRLRLRMFERRRLLLWLWLIAGCAGPFAFDLLRSTYTAAVVRYAFGWLASCLPARSSGSHLPSPPRKDHHAFTDCLRLVAESREYLPSTLRLRATAQRKLPMPVSSESSPSELILVHSIPSGVLGIARYANGSAALASWVGQLGERQVPNSIRALVEGRTLIRFVRFHEIGQPAPEEDWLRENAEVVREILFDRVPSSTSGQETRNILDITRRNRLVFRMSVERRQDLMCGAVLLLIWLAVSIPRLNGPIDLRWDAGTDHVLGTALAEGKGYRLLNEPGEIEAVQYPPLLPLIVAAHQRVIGSSNYFEVGSGLRFRFRCSPDWICLLSTHWRVSSSHRCTRCWWERSLRCPSLFSIFRIRFTLSFPLLWSPRYSFSAIGAAIGRFMQC